MTVFFCEGNESKGKNVEKTSTLTKEEKAYFMCAAIGEAKKAQAIAEVPIGAVVVLEGEIIGRGHNLRETTQDATMHAEMIAIREACAKVGSWRLEDSQLFVTLEPCPMCGGAAMLSRVEEIYVEAGILQAECSDLLRTFFKELRQKKKFASKKTSLPE